MMGNYHVRFGGRERRVLIEARPSRPNAELGAAFLCADLGVTAEPREDHAAYIGSWLRVLAADPKAIFTAASKAMQASEYLLSLRAGASSRVPQADKLELGRP